MRIDNKFNINAYNPGTGKEYNEFNSFLFCAKDKAAPEALRAYINECERIGCDDLHIGNAIALRERVLNFHKTECKIPDTTEEELRNCRSHVEANPAVAAIKYAINVDDGIHFLRLWNCGEFDQIRSEWFDCPEECFIGAEVGYKRKGEK